MSDHLEPTTTDRGFKHMEPIDGRYGETVRAYESSSATHSSVWVSIGSEATKDLPSGPVAAHLTVEDARKLAEQLTWLCDNHYQLQGDETS